MAEEVERDYDTGASVFTSTPSELELDDIMSNRGKTKAVDSQGASVIGGVARLPVMIKMACWSQILSRNNRDSSNSSNTNSSDNNQRSKSINS